MKKIIITGATGLLGSRLVDKMRGVHEIHAVVREPPGCRLEDIVYHQIDLLSAHLSSLPKRADAVFHLAQAPQIRSFPENAADLFSINTQATHALLRYSMNAGVNHFVLASTGGLYGSHDNPIVEETLVQPPEGPLKHYFTTKRCAELLVKDFAEFMNVVIFRPFFIYGANQKSSMLVPRLIEKVRKRSPIELKDGIGASLNPIHVDDAARAFEACLALEDYNLINLAGPETVTIKQMAESIGNVLGTAPNFVDQYGSADKFVVDISKLSRLLVNPNILFNDGVRSILTNARH